MNTVKIKEVQNLSKEKYLVNKYSIVFEKESEQIEIQRIVVERGHGAAILLFNPESKKIILVDQFRAPVFINENTNGNLIEVCAGIIDDNNPISTIIKEVEEETGYKLKNVEKIYEAYMSPGIMTELIHFFVGFYDSSMKISEGGGLASENEWITVLEVSLSEALDWIKIGKIKDAKTIMLLQYAEIHFIK